ncbi:unnamed protein product [Penicillium roqueforti FM164]|uniref:Uncharacterized protein n=1 Tax=Penicillium roqueforti (strain FM164) TaxID=1365484 RepID=W6QNQ2_PENRF|nr:unnamed protein product [Penicillium roqueforti FM164]
MRQDQAEDTMIYSESHNSARVVHQWPTSIPYNIITAVPPNKAFSKTERDLAKK